MPLAHCRPRTREEDGGTPTEQTAPGTLRRLTLDGGRADGSWSAREGRPEITSFPPDFQTRALLLHWLSATAAPREPQAHSLPSGLAHPGPRY